MEIRNNNYNQQSFGMAFLKPRYIKNQERWADNSERALDCFQRHLFSDAKNKRIITRGLKQLKKQQAKNARYDIQYIPNIARPNEYEVQVIEKETDMVIRKIPNSFYSSAYTHPAPRNLSKNYAPRTLLGKIKKTIAQGREYLNIGMFSLKDSYRKWSNPMSELPHAFQEASKMATRLNNEAIERCNDAVTIDKIFS